VRSSKSEKIDCQSLMPVYDAHRDRDHICGGGCIMLRALLVSLCLVGGVQAAPLTPEQIADGWIMLYDGESTFGWVVKGTAKVENGKLILGGKEETILTTTSRFGPFTMQLEYEADADAKLMMGDMANTLDHLGGGLHRADIEYQGSEKQTSWSVNTRLGDKIGGANASATIALTRQPFTIRVAPGKSLTIDRLVLKPTKMTSIFNGKDMTGWKEFADRKSKFTITPEGWLNVKDGPGDLATMGQYDDCVLQLECISNGEFLNSGIFFRCLPDQYQQGYEAQIRNQYALKRTIPVDYGTGAIYRRQAARKVVSNDKEWFTMTILADGPHLATWVNGYQTADFTDDRPMKDNARQGYKAGKGCISIQGHDPTTDLSFRNFKIRELPPSANRE